MQPRGRRRDALSPEAEALERMREPAFFRVHGREPAGFFNAIE
ncbi:hypothetical protein BURKHO8Y_170383 [Burkholderia sp. 8Y]|nr:hypothetical protein BURKHO8Y_170383 [Burkholderia sp. 8Y]